MYSKEQRETALNLYHRCGSVTKTVCVLGYPCRECLHAWIRMEHKPRSPRKQLEIINTNDHPRNPSAKVKQEALHRCFELGESVKSVSEEIGYTRASIYIWRKKYLSGGAASLVNKKNIIVKDLPENITGSETEDIEKLRRQMLDLQLEVDILKETINVLKKDPGADWTTLKNREKTVMIDALKDRYSLPTLFEKLILSKSSYYYQKQAISKADKYKELRIRIRELFKENESRYGYRRICRCLVKEGIGVSEKIVRRVMRQEGLTVKISKTKKYNSYKGEISPAVPNLVERNFHAANPNELLLTDITEFAIPAGKVYLSPMVDCFDGLLMNWRIGTSPNADLVNSMLDDTIAKLGEQDHPVIHSDRGCHYRWPGWIERMEKNGLVRSMSQKGCSPDNAACEGVFGRIKNEMFYNRNWGNVTIDEFMDILNEYLHWYNETRMKETLGYLSPVEYRRSLGLVA